MNELIERLEKATGMDRALDIDIARAIPVDGWRVDEDGSVSAFDGEGWYSMPTEVPSYTHSIDAALTLVPTNHRWSVSGPEVRLDGEEVGADAVVMPFGKYGHVGDFVRHAQPAIALCIAALKARS